MNLDSSHYDGLYGRPVKKTLAMSNNQLDIVVVSGENSFDNIYETKQE